MDGLVQILEEKEMQCPACERNAYFRSFILRDTKPYKVITVKDCTGCGLTETTEDDYEVLGYGVKVSCDFTKNDDSSSDLKRMAFINSRAEAFFYVAGPENEKLELFSFSAEKGCIDCIEGLMMRGDEALGAGYNPEEDTDIKNRHGKFKDMMKGKGFELVIVDSTGYSRVCPAGVEYTEIQDYTLGELATMDPSIHYEKIEKREE